MRCRVRDGELPDPLGAAAERWPRDGRPWVLDNMVSGLDGSAAIGGRVGQLSGPVDRQLSVQAPNVVEADDNLILRYERSRGSSTASTT